MPHTKCKPRDPMCSQGKMLGKMPSDCKALPYFCPQMNSKKLSSVQSLQNWYRDSDKNKVKQRNQLKGVSQNSRNSGTKGKAL